MQLLAYSSLSTYTTDLLEHDVQALARRDAGAVCVGSQQAAGEIAIGDKKKSRWQFIASGRPHFHFDLTGRASNANPVARRQLQALHILRRNLQHIRLFLVLLLEFPLADAAPLPAGAARNQDEGLGHWRFP